MSLTDPKRLSGRIAAIRPRDHYIPFADPEVAGAPSGRAPVRCQAYISTGVIARHKNAPVKLLHRDIQPLAQK
jgi:hypothetical protein